MILSHKICLDPTPSQLTYFSKAAGTARFSWNWALAEWDRQRKDGGKPSEKALRRQLNAIKRSEHPWMLEVTKAAPQHAIKNLGHAFHRFFDECDRVKALRAKGIKAKHNPKCQYPTFKKKGHHDSFRAEGGTDTFQIKGKRIRLPIVGWIKNA
jgi:putative transposase